MKALMRQLGKACCWFSLYYLMANAATFLPMFAFFATLAFYGGGTGDFSYPLSLAYSDIVFLSNILALPLLLFAVFVIARCRRRRLRDELNFSVVVPWQLLFPLLLGVSLQPFVSILLSRLPIPESAWESFNETMVNLDDKSLFGVIATVLIAPIMEETVFRGLIFERLRRGMPTVFALLIQALVFGVLHGNWIQGVYAFLCGIIMGLIYLKYDSLWASILFHLGFNGAGYYIYLVEDISNGAMFVIFSVSVVFALVLAVVIGRIKIKKRGAPFLDASRSQEAAWVS